jgi:coproporphyrinogen III oxidase-like Fe-S oxidoreductase
MPLLRFQQPCARAVWIRQEWREALLADLAHEARLTAKGAGWVPIFFGGGTPSLMPPETAAALIGAAERTGALPTDIEITLEANPSSVEAARFAELAAAGVNRVSLGLQALDDATLAFWAARTGWRKASPRSKPRNGISGGSAST